MTPHRLFRLLTTQTPQARKVFDALMVHEPLTIQQVRAVLVARGSQMPHNAIEGCLHNLARTGLVIASNGRFRAALDASQPFDQLKSPVAKQEATSMTTAIEIAIHQSASVTISAPAGVQSAEAAAPAPSSGLQAATDRVAAIGAEVVEVVAGVRQQLDKLTRLSGELDELAIQITLETDHVNEQIGKLAKVQTLLRELGVSA